MTTIAILYFSGYGHTVKQAEAVAAGVRLAGATPHLIRIPDTGDLTDADWTALDGAQAIVYGSPTYMGAPAWQFKKVADASSARWMGQAWRDKVAGGFTTSASTVGDKGETIAAFMTLSQQHGQVWVGPAVMPSNALESGPADLNWSGGSAGALAIARADASPDQGYEGDMETARLYGQRLATIAATLAPARAAA